MCDKELQFNAVAHYHKIYAQLCFKIWWHFVFMYACKILYCTCKNSCSWCCTRLILIWSRLSATILCIAVKHVIFVYREPYTAVILSYITFIHVLVRHSGTCWWKSIISIRHVPADENYYQMTKNYLFQHPDCPIILFWIVPTTKHDDNQR